MKHPFVQYILAIVIIILAFFSWYFLSGVVKDGQSGSWILPIIFFSLLFVALDLGAVLITEKLIVYSLVPLSFLLSLVFAFDLIHILVILISALIVILGFNRVRKRLDLFVKMNVYQALSVGGTLFVLGITLVISSQYFAEAKYASPQEIVRHFRGNDMTNGLIIKSLSFANPKLKNLDSRTMTVDEFISDLSKDQLQGDLKANEIIVRQASDEVEKKYGDSIPLEEKEKIKNDLISQTKSAWDKTSSENNQLVIEEGRKKLSDLAGVNLKGTEPMSFVFSSIVDWQLMKKIQPENENDRFPIYAIIMSAVLFLVILPLGSVIFPLFSLFASLIFFILVKTKAVKIATVPVEKEIFE
jgi:hypothetical protein